jgi:two-component system sensor histidine kinase/response regulator
MGGDLTVESTPGKGTAFFFTARLGLEQQPEMPVRVAPVGVTARPVLIVEDTETSRELLETLLRSWSIPPVSVATAEEALALLERRSHTGAGDPFGLVILDWMLPGLSGLDAAARIRARDETRTLPIVLISAYAGKEEEAHCAALGVIPKPITASSLFDAVVEAQGAPRVGRSTHHSSGNSRRACCSPRTTRPTRWWQVKSCAARNRAGHRGHRARSTGDGPGGP